jgi:selenocysteine lyase/cysteine desulfurase
MSDFATQFSLPSSTYLLNHSVGRPLKSQQAALEQAFFSPWAEQGKEPWQAWLTIVEDFRNQLAHLFDADASDFCPQVNLSSALTKVVQALPQLNTSQPVILMSESDFPSMGFVLQQALGTSVSLKFIPKTRDVSNASVWFEYLTREVDLVFISHAYSNLGALAPIDDIVARARELNVLSVLDIAQSAGVIPLSISNLRPDVMIGSSVKWLCGGPGAAYLWMEASLAETCQPKDVGWFSHENPFEMDIHHFQPHSGVQRFWGGTPSVLPYAVAAHALQFWNRQEKDALRNHNLALTQPILEAFEDYAVSPLNTENRSGTMVFDFGVKTDKVKASLETSGFECDQRAQGIRLSPHLYNSQTQMQQLTECIKKAL